MLCGCGLMRLRRGVYDTTRAQGQAAAIAARASDTTTCRRTATVMGQGRNVDDFDDFDTGTVDGTDSGFTSRAGSFDVYFYFAEAEAVGYFRAVLAIGLGGIGGLFL